ncbi:MAG: ABC transporter ATP-binding protein [Actinomycetota bacterium]|nr:ABC transporter ATP-binding protein [Actinomycetota bacterium]
MLVVDNLSVSYGHIQALRDVSLTVARGEMVALIGANGAGKTTTLRAISGLVSADSGAVRWDDTLLTGMAAERISKVGLAHIPEGRGVFPRLTVAQNLKMGAYVRRKRISNLDADIESALELFPQLGPRMNQPAGTMSGGEQQMLAIARALVGKPSFLMLDEPSHGLAPAIVEHVFELLDHLREQGLAVLVVEQHVAAVLSRAQRAYVLERGRVTLAGASADLEHGRLADAYLGSLL